MAQSAGFSRLRTTFYRPQNCGSKTTGAKKYDTPFAAQQRNNRRKAKGPTLAGPFDEFPFRSVHFASLAI
jgi:hypothetical protein